MFKGSLVALITPMRADGSVDEKAFPEFVDWQIAEGTDGLVPVGTTGESPTLSHDEHKRVVEIVHRGRARARAGDRRRRLATPPTRRSTSRAMPRRPARTRRWW